MAALCGRQRSLKGLLTPSGAAADMWRVEVDAAVFPDLLKYYQAAEANVTTPGFTVRGGSSGSVTIPGGHLPALPFYSSCEQGRKFLLRIL